MTEPAPERIHEQNRRSWNAITPVHNSHKRDQAKFLREGGSTLFPEELELAGDLDGRTLLHLQCNCGQDTLSLAQLGATVTGVDISDAAIEFANQLSADSGIPGTFVRDDLFAWFDQNDTTFDIVFTTYGGVGWLADIDRWARGIHKSLVPGGRFVFLEFHPVCWSFGTDGRLTDSYFLDAPIHEAGGVNDYVDAGLAPSGFASGTKDFQNPERAISFQWTVADILQSLIDAGLTITAVREYPYANGCQIVDGMQELPGRRFRLPEGLPEMPWMLGITATRPR